MMRVERPESGARLGELRTFLDECYEELDGDEFEEYSLRVVTTLSRRDAYAPETMDMIAHFCARVTKIVEACGTHESDVRQIQALSNVLHIVEENFMVPQAGLTLKESRRLRQRGQDIQRYCKEARNKVESISNKSVKIVTKPASRRLPSRPSSTSLPRPSPVTSRPAVKSRPSPAISRPPPQITRPPPQISHSPSQTQLAPLSTRSSPLIPRPLSSTLSRSSSKALHSPSVVESAQSEPSLVLDDPVKVEEVESNDINRETIPEVYDISDDDDDDDDELEDDNRESTDMDIDSEDDLVTEDSLWTAQDNIIPWFKINGSQLPHILTFLLDPTHLCFTQTSLNVDEEDEAKQISVELVLFIKIVADALYISDLGFQLWITDVDCDPPELFSQDTNQSLYWIILPRASIKPGRNSLECTIKFNSSTHDPHTEMSLDRVVMCSIKQMTEIVLKNKCSPVSTHGLIDNFQQKGQEVLTLLDPISQKLIKVPVRGNGCDHLECFDLNTFLKDNQGARGRWKCPVLGCIETCKPGSLWVDEWVANNIEIARNGGQDKMLVPSTILEDDVGDDVDIKPEVDVDIKPEI
ncbi:uncharacterized protein MELLADRAFT_112073 [Melampsora larici-populina 98AG31]|uniref:SP-RING-type domain-containing protein n=1 Tax=Melampsora larici-populina (strain 98AG31 / pathotype 3-4-7) TaxID=747676 RepID=F4S5A6_MELLP|nr:uncharacterized protein MELLADRAFT_112073 [Melampsora larici-populina 98AG31]EGG00192.1 hypothetical protein MELLADRAFT_112073 [Melampsora larici-populina 98AG31]